MSHHSHQDDNSLAGSIKKDTGVSAARCYQCGKCSAGCPLAVEMDYPPSLVMRMLQIGEPAMDKKVLQSRSIWLCLTCEMCIARCPMEVDIPVAMDYLRQYSLRKGLQSKEAGKIIAFHKSFLGSIKRTGRLYEMGLIVEYKMRTFKLMQDVLLAPVMFAKGKLHIMPEKVKNRKQIKEIFEKTKMKKEVSE